MNHAPPAWAALLAEAVTTPGVISSAYNAFWDYSLGNQILAYIQCLERKLTPGPLNTFMGWKDLGRKVKKGEKALILCMPVSWVGKANPRIPPETEEKPEDDRNPVIRRFIYRPNWFVLSQTDGAEYVPTALPDWDEDRALATLSIERIVFDHPDGNCQGYARSRSVAVSPIAFLPHRTMLHEIAHVVLGHTAEIEGLFDGAERTPKSLREAEAECVALLCSASLKLPGAEFSRGYIQNWIGHTAIPERSAQRIFKAANDILRAGRLNPAHDAS